MMRNDACNGGFLSTENTSGAAQAHRVRGQIGFTMTATRPGVLRYGSSAPALWMIGARQAPHTGRMEVAGKAFPTFVSWILGEGRRGCALPLQPGKPGADQEEPFGGHVAALVRSF